MGCKKYKIQDYFILQNLQNKVDTYTYDHITGRQSLPKTAQQLLLCIQNILRILFQICDLRTKYKFLNITTYTYAPSSLRSKSSSRKQRRGRIPSTNSKYIYEWTGEQLSTTYNRQKKKPFTVLTNGNKNIIARLNKKRELSAKFIYSLFSGLKPSSPAANEVRFKFSSEYLDPETGLVYYNYRYYSPELGRWLSRDPIAIVGSVPWWAGNAERIGLKNALELVEKKMIALNSFIGKSPKKRLMNEIEKQKQLKLFIQYELQMDLLGKRNNGNNDNPYEHTGNNPINENDNIGLWGWGDTWNVVTLTGGGIVAIGVGLFLGTVTAPAAPVVLITGGIITLIGATGSAVTSGGFINDMWQHLNNTLIDNSQDGTLTPGGAYQDSDGDGTPDAIDDYPNDPCKI